MAYEKGSIFVQNSVPVVDNEKSRSYNYEYIKNEEVEIYSQINKNKKNYYVADQIPDYEFNPVASSYQKIHGVPVNIVCPRCKRNVITKIERKSCTKTGLAIGATAFFHSPLSLIPSLIKPIKEKVHRCPECNFNMGEYLYVENSAVKY
ncbi:hypothetical protein AYI68_g1807 [Smittium mucronatum]|uniref:LITAF domain-containing protein n=1 Tax=Smittium mucronatum TaxID=133383 RepID=A0A1R0H4B6_9FUNG|nr:hypothetical protein AYI68_g1807 [Smittium mucronatum]